MQEKTINEPGRKDGERITNGPLLMGRWGACLEI